MKNYERYENDIEDITYLFRKCGTEAIFQNDKNWHPCESENYKEALKKLSELEWEAFNDIFGPYAKIEWVPDSGYMEIFLIWLFSEVKEL